MTEKKVENAPPDLDLIIDRIYQIALEPSSLDGFINLWHDEGLRDHFYEADGEDRNPAKSLASHVQRADSLLQRDDNMRSDLDEFLRPYINLSALVLNCAMVVEAINSGGQTAFRIGPGSHLRDIRLPPKLQSNLFEITKAVLAETPPTERILKADLESKGGTILFRIMQLPEALHGSPAALIVSTHFHWRDSIGTFLCGVFGLTSAEQEVVRMLVQGQDAKHIAKVRATTDGTVRGQIKSIIRKMNVRSQTDIVRLTMTLGDFPTDAPKAGSDVTHTSPVLTSNWLEAEVWKPFKTLTLPDGRKMTYHDMGPSIGNPILFSHMGSCMVRWSRPMIRLAFEHNLRVICPIRAGYGHSAELPSAADPIETASADAAHLAREHGITRVPYVAQGTDFLFAADVATRFPGLISEIVGVGARPCLPGGQNIVGQGRWQRFFVSTARNSPHLVQFASRAVMAMSRRIGPGPMLRQLCKDSAADLRLLEDEDMNPVLVANLSLMAGPATNAAQAFASEYIAFQSDWSASVQAVADLSVSLFLAKEDPTFDLSAIPQLKLHYPWMTIEVVENAGLALMFQDYERLIAKMAQAARSAALPPAPEAPSA